MVAAPQPDGKPNLEGGCRQDTPYALDASFPWLRLPDGKGLALVYGYAQEPATRSQDRSPERRHQDRADGRPLLPGRGARRDSPGLADQVGSLDAVASDGSVIATETKGQIAPPAHP